MGPYTCDLCGHHVYLDDVEVEYDGGAICGYCYRSGSREPLHIPSKDLQTAVRAVLNGIEAGKAGSINGWFTSDTPAIG